MTLRTTNLSAALILCLVLSFPTATQAQSPPEIDRQVAQWIEKLGSPKFSDRVAATRQLQRLGSAVIDPLAKVILNGSSDAADRAIGILQNHFHSDSPATSDAAQAALERIAEQSDHPKAAVAKKILTPVATPRTTPNPRPQIQLAPPAIQRQRINVSVKTINGKREVLVDENGRKFRFADVGDALKVERPDDQGGVQTKQYKNEDELKQADAEAYKIYKRYARGNGNQIQIQMNARGFGGPLPPGFMPRNFRPQQPPMMQPPVLPKPGDSTPGQLGDPQQKSRPPANPIKPVPPVKPKPKLIEV